MDGKSSILYSNIHGALGTTRKESEIRDIDAVSWSRSRSRFCDTARDCCSVWGSPLDRMRTVDVGKPVFRCHGSIPSHVSCSTDPRQRSLLSSLAPPHPLRPSLHSFDKILNPLSSAYYFLLTEVVKGAIEHDDPDSHLLHCVTACPYRLSCNQRQGLPSHQGHHSRPSDTVLL
jgi:hypothetical protein